MAAAPDSAFLRAVLAAHPRQFGAAMERAPKLRFQARALPPCPPCWPQPPCSQVLVSEVREGGRGGEPELLRHGFRADEEYFYPASSRVGAADILAPAPLTPAHPVPPASLAALAEWLQRHLTLALPSPSIKICAAIAALQELSRLQTSLGVELSPTTPLTVLPLFSSYPDAQDKDPSNLNGGKITVAHEIRKLFLARLSTCQ
eukprot:SM000195S05297  [mRNA]  locus=s195:257341:258197:- [translate_table: standard]